MRGNRGSDTVSYATRRKPVEVTLSRGKEDDVIQGTLVADFIDGRGGTT